MDGEFIVLLGTEIGWKDGYWAFVVLWRHHEAFVVVLGEHRGRERRSVV